MKLKWLYTIGVIAWSIPLLWFVPARTIGTGYEFRTIFEIIYWGHTEIASLIRIKGGFNSFSGGLSEYWLIWFIMIGVLFLSTVAIIVSVIKRKGIISDLSQTD